MRDVVVSSRKQDLCDQVAAEITRRRARTSSALACHVGEWDAIPAFVEAVIERFGRIDVLVNNAGINPARITVADMTLEFWRKVFSVNLEGPLRMSQCVAPIMRDQGGGSIINIATMARVLGRFERLRLRRVQGRRWSTSPRAWPRSGRRGTCASTSLSPGPFLTEMIEGGARNAPGFMELIAGGTYMKRVADPHEIVGPVVYLASDASSLRHRRRHLRLRRHAQVAQVEKSGTLARTASARPFGSSQSSWRPSAVMSRK